MDPMKSLKVKTGTLKRLLKELQSYEDEVVREQAKTEKMKAAGADTYDLKQQENVLAESRAMIPDCQKRLEAAFSDLQEVLGSLAAGLQGSEEMTVAQDILAQAQPLVNS